jgi:hypothetical protein
MDEDYARKLRAWLRAEPEATPRQAEEEREWLRDVPAPHPDPERWTVRGQLPAAQPEADDEWVCPVIELPVPRTSKENGCRMSGVDARSRRSQPSGTGDQRDISEAEARSRRNHPSGRLSEEPFESRPLSDVEARGRRNHPSGRPPEGAADQRGISEAEAQSRRNHPSGRLGEEPAEPRPLSEAEARSRWNHPSNWHRRRREEQALPHHEEREPGSH